jgi:phospholipid/cholesterol/gamma-HCH transport system permease protein
MSAEPIGFEIAEKDGGQVLVATGDWTVWTIPAVEDALRALADAAGPVRALDASRLGAIDTAGALALDLALRPDPAASPAYAVTGGHETAGRLLGEVQRFRAPCEAEPARLAPHLALLDDIGRGMAGLGVELLGTLDFVGRTVVATGRSLIAPRRIRWVQVFAVAEQAGLNAVPIVATLSFFIGAVVAYMGANILAQFGASVFTVELVGISVLREFGVLITAIILAGRSDSAFTAQIGAMRMQQEVDALDVLGLDPMEVLVVPRVLALLIMTPVLTLVAMLAGLVGGGLVTWSSIDVSPAMFLFRLQEFVGFENFWPGMLKAPVFALIIAVIGCRHGLSVEGDVLSLGRRTTTAVVQAIFMVIVVDAVFAMIYLELDV